MNINYLVVTIKPSGGEELQERFIIFEDGEWKIKGALFPREIRLVARLEELIRDFNSKTKGIN